MRIRCATLACLVLLVNCGGNPAPRAPVAEPQATAAAPEPQPPSPEREIGLVRVNVSSLNVRASASASAQVVGHVRRGERLTLLGESGDWLRVRLHDGASGWVASQLVVREGAAARPRRAGCPPDSDYSFLTAPKPSFSEGGAHGMVIIETSVDAQGVVTGTRVLSNDTHDDALAAMAEREMHNARFAPPIRNCNPRAFVFTYKRAF